MSKRLIDFNDDELLEAQQILGTPTVSATVREAVSRVVRQRRHERLLDYFATMSDEQRDLLARARDDAW